MPSTTARFVSTGDGARFAPNGGVAGLRTTSWPVIAIVALAFCLRVGLVLLSPHYLPRFDALDYSRHAESIAHGHGFPPSLIVAGGGPSAFRSPLWPYLLGAVYAVAGHATLTGGRLLSALFNTVSVWLIWLIARQLFGQRIALLAGLGAAIFPPLVALNASLLTESLFVMLMLAFIALVLRTRRTGSPLDALAAGVVCGAATMTRGDGILLVLVGVAGVCTSASVRTSAGGARAWRRILLLAGVLLLGTALALVPWTVRNAETFHAFVPISTESGYAYAGTLNDVSRTYPGYPGTWLLPQQTEYAPLFRNRRLNEAQLDDRLRSLIAHYAASHPQYTAKLVALNVLRGGNLLPLTPASATDSRLEAGVGSGWVTPLAVTTWVAELLALLGLLALFLRAAPRPPWFLWLCPVLLLIAAGPAGESHRYAAPAYPFLMWLAAIAVDRARALRFP